MKAIFFDPHLDTIGGGERYVLTVVDYLVKKGWKVDILWENKEVVKKYKDKFGIDLDTVGFLPSPKNIFEKWKVTRNYDLSFWLSDGSIPFAFSKKNILHFQVPFHNVNGQSFLNKIKFRNIHHVICNSGFTKRFVDKEYNVVSKVIYPPVDIQEFKPGKKQNIVLYVGRFSQLLQAKRHNVLITVFKKMIDKGFSGWKLVLAGGTEIGGMDYLNELKCQVGSYPIEFWENPPLPTLQKLYAKAKIFWSASGYGIDENDDPEKVEHFGITVAEAMAAGCVPLVIAKGGHRHIVKEKVNGFLWKNEEELIKLTLVLAKDTRLLKKLSAASIRASERYSLEKFYENLAKII